ncbi:hypothetical protein [Rhodococcus sp. AW25M09]|uniref:hypothetical protein n=1 Tax=Rhodococcus sp. AW25M09 TaxID=1268303 RepID=UPI00034B3907|nr:hypothetical protein [Rhodococcus sp. AW25M09]
MTERWRFGEHLTHPGSVTPLPVCKGDGPEAANTADRNPHTDDRSSAGGVKVIDLVQCPIPDDSLLGVHMGESPDVPKGTDDADFSP